MDARTILIVDDDKDFLRGLGMRLKSDGYRVVGAADGVTATSVALKEKPDLVLLDLGLPGGGGFMVLERMKALLPLMTTPVIVVSARDPAANSERALQAGALAFLQKPVENEVLLTAIRKALGESP
jgi:DNA-binding response OmpR family regulator